MKFTVEVTQLVEVELDESKFTPEFMQEFRASFYPFHSLTEHAEHIAWTLSCSHLYHSGPHTFIEGYGEAQELGIKVTITDKSMETIEP